MADMERKIAIEYDGSPHFLTELKDGAKMNHGRENGQSLAKRRLLEKMGWKVISIPFHVNIAMNRLAAPARKAAKVSAASEQSKRTARKKLRTRPPDSPLPFPCFLLCARFARASLRSRLRSQVNYLRDLLARNGVEVTWTSVKGVDYDVEVEASLTGPDASMGFGMPPPEGAQYYADPTDPYAAENAAQYGGDPNTHQYGNPSAHPHQPFGNQMDGSQFGSNPYDHHQGPNQYLQPGFSSYEPHAQSLYADPSHQQHPHPLQPHPLQPHQPHPHQQHLHQQHQPPPHGHPQMGHHPPPPQQSLYGNPPPPSHSQPPPHSFSSSGAPQGLSVNVPAWSAGPPKFDSTPSLDDTPNSAPAGSVSAAAAPFVPHSGNLDPMPTFSAPSSLDNALSTDSLSSFQLGLDDASASAALPAFLGGDQSHTASSVSSAPVPPPPPGLSNLKLVSGPGYVFHTNKETRSETAAKSIFGSSSDGPYRDLQVGAPCFLFDYSSQMYEGIFIAETVCTKNIDK
jgi:hypothetical protein